MTHPTEALDPQELTEALNKIGRLTEQATKIAQAAPSDAWAPEHVSWYPAKLVEVHPRRGPGSKAVGWRAVCSCGWRGSLLVPASKWRHETPGDDGVPELALEWAAHATGQPQAVALDQIGDVVTAEQADELNRRADLEAGTDG